MEEATLVTSGYYIQTQAAVADDRTCVLKHDDMVGVFDLRGDIDAAGLSKNGIFLEDTRFLSRLALRLEGQRPELLGSNIKDQDALLAVDLTNPDISDGGHVTVPRETIHLFRSKFLWRNVCYERLRFLSYSKSPVHIAFSFELEADFVDMFEVRGTKRERRGERLEDATQDDEVVLSYRGLDALVRRTRIRCSPTPERISPTELKYEVTLEPKREQSFCLTIACEQADERAPALSYDEAFTQRQRSLRKGMKRDSAVRSSNGDVNQWLSRSESDLHLMITDTPYGPYPYGGLPWFNSPFGRDGIITALESLWMAPWIAKGVLAYLAATQATETIPESDAEPGKILHERRLGEMARLKEVPFARYYGSIDSTPLFIMLAAAYYERTADREFIQEIWPSIDLALRWIDDYGDKDGDGFVEYSRQSSDGLEQQGWKDSRDSVFHANGDLAKPPVALCEVQGYVYAAWRGAARLAAALGFDDRARELAWRAQILQERFEEAFWCEGIATYALALDGAKRPCRVRASNAGHCLFTGIARRDHALKVGETLLGGDFFSGWGVRTLGATEARYNPMSYHNGSVWPHDNAIIAAGLARYGMRDSALKIACGLLDVSRQVNLRRLPELFCGFTRRPYDAPVQYPVACAPQSWAIASVFLLIQTCLGLTISAPDRQITFAQPVLPDAIESFEIKNLRVGEASADLAIRRRDGRICVDVLRKQGELQINLD